MNKQILAQFFHEFSFIYPWTQRLLLNFENPEFKNNGNVYKAKPSSCRENWLVYQRFQSWYYVVLADAYRDTLSNVHFHITNSVRFCFEVFLQSLYSSFVPFSGYRLVNIYLSRDLRRFDFLWILHGLNSHRRAPCCRMEQQPRWAQTIDLKPWRIVRSPWEFDGRRGYHFLCLYIK